MYNMFILSELQDIVRIEPHRFSQDMEQQIRDELNKKFANKVSRKSYDNHSHHTIRSTKMGIKLILTVIRDYYELINFKLPN